jgi:hypothetical protein
MKLKKSVASVILSVISAIFFILGLFYSFFVWEILLPLDSSYFYLWVIPPMGFIMTLLCASRLIWTAKKGKVRTLVGMGFIVLLHILVICWMGLFALAYSDPKEQIPTSIIIGFALIILAFVALYVLSIYLFKIIDKK